MARHRRGTLAVSFVDGTRREFALQQDQDQIWLEWPGDHGIANEHPVRNENSTDCPGWVREVAALFNLRVRAYDYLPERKRT